MLNIPFTIRFSLSLFIFTSLMSTFTDAKSASENAEETHVKSVATVIPIAQSLLTELLATTNITIHYLPPKRLPINRLTNWVATHASKKQPDVTALVGIDAIRPSLSFYTALRKENIQLINIDIAKALIPGGEQVAIYQHNQQGYFWLNINNALLMTGILRRDLTALWPKHANIINANAAAISQQLRQISMQLDDDLYDKNIEQLVVDKPVLADFAASFPLPIVTLAQAKENGFNTLLISKNNANSHASNKDKKTALTHNIRRWAIDDFSKTSPLSFTKRWLNNSNNIH